MKKLLCLFMCALACSGPVLAQPGETADADDVCSSRFATLLPGVQVAGMQAPIKEAIATLDNARIELPSPTLASGNATHLDVSPDFINRSATTVCVLGYFSFQHNGQRSTVPLRVNHIESHTSHAGEGEVALESTHIYFRVPKIEEFDNTQDLQRWWQFWERSQPMELHFAAFHYINGKRGAPIFGHDIELKVSSKPSSILAAVLFAVSCYATAAVAVTVVYRRSQGRSASVHKPPVWRLLPWHITGGSGRASLSQLQMLLFTLIVASLLFYQWLRTGVLQDLSVDLLYLIGLSTAGAAGTQLTTSIRKELEPSVYQYAQQLGWFTAPAISSNRHATAADLLMTNKRFDIYKFQMLVFSFVIAAYVIVSGADQLGNIQISATLLTLMGISQGAYVGGRATGESLLSLQDQLRGLQSLQERYESCTDPLVCAELRHRYLLAAAQTGALFGAIFERALPEYLLDMPIDRLKPRPPVAAAA